MAIALPKLNTGVLSVSLAELKQAHGAAPWADRIIMNDRTVATVICQPPGQENDWHYHLADEWWMIAEGEQAWEIEGQDKPIYVKAGDFVLAPANCCHLIHVLGDKPAIRIAVSYNGEWHRHERENPPMPPVPTGIRKAR